MKGILFPGDSFTWGEGLHMYSELPDIKFDEQGHDGKNYTPAHVKFIETNRFARKVANHFNTFELLRASNGGSNNMMFEFIDKLPEQYKRNNMPPVGSDLVARSVEYRLEDFDYIVLQLSDMFRDDVEFKYKNNIGFCNIKSMESINNSGFIYYLKDEFNNDINKFIQYYLEKSMNTIIEKFKLYESKGIKRCFIHTWQNEPIPFFLNNSYLNERWITYNVDNIIYNSIWDLQRNNELKGMSLNDDDFFLKKEIIVHNGHTSLAAHNIQANAIIKKIEEYEQSTIHSVQRPII
jgi:hypothetical protein